MIYQCQIGDETYRVQLEAQANGYLTVIGDQEYSVEILENQPGQLTFRLEGRSIRIYWAFEKNRLWISNAGCTCPIDNPTPKMKRTREEQAGSGRILAPMPALVRSIDVFPGERVKKGQTVLHLEAMKMEIRLNAPIDGRVDQITVQAGQTIQRDVLLLVIEPVQENPQ